MDETILKRTMPYSLEAEQSVIGSMVTNNESINIASEMITADDFYQKQYGMLFQAMVEMYNDGQAVDPVTLQNKLNSMDVPPEVASLSYLGDIITMVPTSVHVKEYAQVVKDKSLLRQIIKVSENIENTCYEGKDSVDKILEQQEKDVFSLIQNRGVSDYVPISDVVMNALAQIERVSHTKGSVTGISTGFRDLDFKTAGFQNSDLVIIAARPAMGKTAFVLNVAESIVMKQDKCAAIFSLEMSKEQLINRMFSLESKVEADKLRRGNLNDSEWEALAMAASELGNSKLIIDDTPGITISQLKSKCRKYKLEHDLSIIIIDYLQLMSGGGKSESRQQEISEISRSLKSLARELNVPVIALSQLSRSVEQRVDKRPMLSDLRESGSIEQDADVVMFIYRDDYYNPDTEYKNVSEIIIAKQRHGSIGTVQLAWLPEYTRFADYAGNNVPEV